MTGFTITFQLPDDLPNEMQGSLWGDVWDEPRTAEEMALDAIEARMRSVLIAAGCRDIRLDTRLV